MVEALLVLVKVFGIQGMSIFMMYAECLIVSRVLRVDIRSCTVCRCLKVVMRCLCSMCSSWAWALHAMDRDDHLVLWVACFE